MKLLGFLLSLVFFTGCTITPQTHYIEYKPSQNIVYKKSVPQPITYTGYIKGKIKQISYDAATKNWVYIVIADDISNGKLPYAKFSYEKKVANQGGFIYAKIESNILKEYFLSKKFEIKKVQKKKPIKQKQMKYKKIPNIGLPQSEEILLD